jgi:quinol monooxygenase YgiN
MSGGRVIVAGTLRMPPGRFDEIAPHVQAYVAACRREEGCIEFSFAQDVSDPSLFRIFEIWENQHALSRHGASAHVAAWRTLWPSLGLHDRNLRTYPVADAPPA